MGTTGAPWQMPYPDGTARPCDAADAIAALGARLDEQITAWGRDDARLRRRPAAVVAYESTTTYTINRAALDQAQFNTVLLDTAGMVDLGSRPDRIYFPATPRPALYAIGGQVIGRSTVQPTTVDVRLNTNARWSTPLAVDWQPYREREQTQDRGDQQGEVFGVGGTMIVHRPLSSVDETAPIYMWLEIASGGELTVARASMWAFWLTDF